MRRANKDLLVDTLHRAYYRLCTARGIADASSLYEVDQAAFELSREVLRLASDVELARQPRWLQQDRLRLQPELPLQPDSAPASPEVPF